MCFHFSWVNTTGMELLFNFLKKMPCSFPKWLYHLTLPPAIYENSSCSTQETFDIVNLTNFNHFSGYELSPLYVFTMYFFF